MKIPFIGRKFHNHFTETDRNFYPEMEQRGTQFTDALYGTPGLTTWLDPGVTSEVRALFPSKDKQTLFAVIGNGFYTITTSGVATKRGTLNTASYPCTIRVNATQAMVVDGNYGYIWDGTVFKQIFAPAFIGGGSLDYIDGYFIVHDPNTQEWAISGLNDGTSWSSLDTATAEGWPDNIVRVFADHRELLLFGTDSIEPWYDSGATNFPFERISGAFIEYGLGAKDSVAKADNSVFFLTHNNLVARLNAYTPQIVSTRLVEQQIANLTRVDDAIGYTMNVGGHIWYVLTFPTADATWVYDVPMNFWFRWASYPSFGRHRGNCFAYFAGKNLVGDFENGKIYAVDPEAFTDDGNEIHGQWTFPPVAKEREWLFYREFELHMYAGLGLEDGTEPFVIMQSSDDGGVTWSGERVQSAGNLGEYDRRVYWYRLGRSRNRIFRVKMSSPTKRIFYGAYCDVSGGTD